MKRGWMIILLLSVGLNIGLGLNLLRRGAEAPPPPDRFETPADEPPDPARVEHFMRQRLDRMADELSLDASQRDALWTPHRDAGREVFERRHAMAAARLELQAAYADPQWDADAILAAVRRMSATQSRLDSLVTEVMLHEREILTPEQRRHYHPLFPMGDHRFPRGLKAGPRREPRHGHGQAR